MGNSDHFCTSKTRLGQESGAEPTAAAGWAAGPGLCGPWKDLPAEGRAPCTAGSPGRPRAGEGGARGSPTGGSANQALSPPSNSTDCVGPETPQVFPVAGRPTASDARARK